MRLVLVLGLVAAALAASGRSRSQWDSEERTHIREHEYRASREYRYEYNGQIATGFPQASEQHASTRIQALLSVYVKDQNNAVFQIRKVRVGQMNEEVPEPREVQPFEAYDEIEIQPEHERLLKLPVRVQYERGLVGDLEFDSEDAAWSKNIKKAILSVMQVNLEKNDRTDRDELKKLGHEDQDKTQEFYTVSEKTVEGECESAYTVVKMPRQEQDESSVERLQVSKSINFEKCRRRVDLRYGLRFGSECKSCEKKFTDDEKNTESSTIVAYNVTRRQSGSFLIREVDVRSQYVFAPLAQSHNVLTTISVARLVLNEIKEKPQSVPEPKRGDKEEIIYSTEFDEKKERFAMNGDEEYLEHFPYGEQQNKVQLIEKAVAAMLKHMNAKDNSIDAEAPHMMARLVKLLRWTTKDELQKIVRLYYTESEKLEQDAVEKLQSIVADALAIAGTKNTVETLTQMISDKKISVLKAVQVLKTLVNVPVPSEKQVESLLRLCQSSHSERNPALKQSCWLTTGAVMHALCGSTQEKYAVQQLENNNKKMCPRQLKEKYVKVIMEQYKKAETRYEKVLALKTLANAGIDMSVFELEKLIRDESLDKTVRMQAIDALRQLRDQMPRKIQSLLMPVLKNKYEHVEVRMNAFYQLLETLPERHLLDQIAAQLRFEPSQQLQAFVYTSMLQFANSTNPCQKKMAEDLQASLRMARVSQPRRLQEQSRYKHLPLYSQSALSGMSLNWASIFGNNSYLPKEMMASIDTVLAGEWNKYALQFGFYQQNLETVIAKVLEMVKGEKLADMVVRGKRSSDSRRPQEQLRELFKALKIRSRRGEGQEPHGLLYIRYKDLDYAFVPLDEETMPEMLKGMMQQGQFKLQSLERLLATGYNFDANMAAFFYETQRKIPTSMGLPLVVSGKIPTVASIRGQIKVELQPKSSQKMSGVKVRIAIEPRIAATHVTKMELWNPMANSGIKVLHDIQAVLPIDSTVSVDTEGQKGVQIETVFKMPQHKKRLFSAQTRPVTFTRVWQQKNRVYTEAQEKTIISELLPQHQDIDKVYGEKEMGVRVNVQGHWHRHLLQQQQPGAPAPILAGHNFVHVEYEPTNETPKEIRTQITIDGFDELDKMEDIDDLQKFYEKKIRFGSEEDLFDTDDVEEFPEDENERRLTYTRYSKEIRDKKAFRHNLVVKFETVGGVRREGEFKLESVCDEEIRVCKWTVRCQHTPFSREGRGLWTLKADMQTLYPKMAFSLEELKEQKHREFTLQLNAEWGQEQKSRANVKVQGEQNYEQKLWMRRVERETQDKKQPIEIYEQMLEAAQLNQYKVVVDYEISPRGRSIYNSAYETLKRWFAWEAEVSLSKTRDNQLTAKLSIDPRYRQLINLTIETPEERLRLLDVQLPTKVSPLNIRREYGRVSSLQGLLKKGVSGSRAECEVKSTRVNTFDDVLYKAPITTCYSVLAKDCSDEEPKFVVLMKKLEKNGEEKKLKVISEENVIEIEQPKNDEPLEIFVNGQRLEKKQIRQLQDYNIELKQEGELVTIELEDVTVHFDGYSARIELSPLYLSQQCGVCGHYDGERGDEFRGADNELTDDLQAFHSSFLQKEECEMDSEYTQKSHFRVFDSEEQDSEESEQSLFYTRHDSQEQEYKSEETSEEQLKPRREQRKQQKDSSEETSEERQTRKPLKKTRVLEQGEQICFSKKALPECPRKTYAMEDKKVEKEVDFACFDRSSVKARDLLRDVRRGEIVDVRNEPSAFQHTVEVPTLCVVY